MPKGFTWIKDFTTGFNSANNGISTKVSGDVSDEFLIVSPDLVMDNSKIEGLTKALGKDVVLV